MSPAPMKFDDYIIMVPASGPQIAKLSTTWRVRQHPRRELNHFIPSRTARRWLVRSDVVYEAEKPFWRA